MFPRLPEHTYMIMRFCFDDSDPAHRSVVKRGLSLAEAQAHCQNPNTRYVDPETNNVIWFDGYQEEH